VSRAAAALECRAMTNDDSLFHAGEAALGLVESLLLYLVDAKKLEPDEYAEIFETLIAAHEEAAIRTADPKHRAIIHLLERVQSGQNGVRLARAE
jgi:hypothetical protein